MQSVATGAYDATRGLFCDAPRADNTGEVPAVVVALSACQHVPAFGQMEREELKIVGQKQKKIAHEQ